MYLPNQLSQRINQYIKELAFSRKPQGLYNPIEYVLSPGGKRIRPVLMLMAYNLYRDDVEAIFDPATAIEVYHNYTLLHDDLMDRADMRRGKATVHKVWNDNAAILSGDAMLVLAYQYMARVKTDCLKPVMDLFSQTALEICEGQQLDMEFETRHDVTEEEYIEMIRLKTSVLLAASLKIGALLGDASSADANALYDFGMHMGVAFQLKDDWLDVYGDPAVFGKKIGGDILCNKKTYMLIQALRSAKGNQLNELNDWIEAEQPNPQEKIAAVTRIYNATGVKQMCEEQIALYTRKGLESLERVALPAEMKEQLSQLMLGLIDRQS